MKHLAEKTREFVLANTGTEGIPAKIEYIRKKVWVGYPVIKEIELEMTEVLTHPRVGRMPNLLILARTNNGKSSVLRRFAKKHQALTEESTGSVRAPVIGLIMPEGPTETLFLDSILRATSLGTKRTDTYRDKYDQVLRTMESLQTKVILIDEIHHIAAGSYKQQRLLLNFIKNLSTINSLSFVVAGTAEARNIFSADEQLANRFRHLIIPTWEDNDDLVKLLYGFEALLPFEEPSEFPVLSKYILDQTDRTIGDIYNLLERASIVALKNGEKNVSKKRLGNCGHLSPTQKANAYKRTI